MINEKNHFSRNFCILDDSDNDDADDDNDGFATKLGNKNGAAGVVRVRMRMRK